LGCCGVISVEKYSQREAVLTNTLKYNMSRP